MRREKVRKQRPKTPRSAASASRIPQLATEAEIAQVFGGSPRRVRVMAMMGMPTHGMPRGAKLLNWLAPPDAPDRIELLTQSEMAAELGISTRQLQNLEEKGLPAVGERADKRYAFPLAYAWYHTYRRRYEQGGRREVVRLDWQAAATEFQDFCSLARAVSRLRSPKVHENGDPLDDDAAAMLPMARQIVASGRWDGDGYI